MNEHINAINQPYIKSDFEEHILSTGHNYTNTQKNLEVLNKVQKGPKLNTLEQSEIYSNYKTQSNKI